MLSFFIPIFSRRTRAREIRAISRGASSAIVVMIQERRLVDWIGKSEYSRNSCFVPLNPYCLRCGSSTCSQSYNFWKRIKEIETQQEIVHSEASLVSLVSLVSLALLPPTLRYGNLRSAVVESVVGSAWWRLIAWLIPKELERTIELRESCEIT